MRGGRSLLLLLVLALGVGAYIYFVEMKRDLTDPADRRDKAFSIAAGQIDGMEIHGASGEVTIVKKVGEEWRLTAPVSAPADQAVVGSIASALEGLEIQRILEDTPSSVSPFGLAPARFSVSFTVAGDVTSRQLEIGNKTPTGSDVYARVTGQPKVLLVSAYLEDTLARSTFDLRDKTVLKFSRGEIDTITLTAARAPAVSLKRTASDWTLTTPLSARADWTTVDGLISRVSDAQMTSVVPDTSDAPTPADLKRFGLDAPQFVASFGTGSTAATLAFGNAHDKGVYARDLSRPLVFTVDAGLLSDLKKQPADLRMKDIFEFKSFSASSLTISQGGLVQTFAKASTPASSNAPAEDVWKQTQPTAKDVNQTAMTDLLNTLSSLRATGFTEQSLTSGDDVVVAATIGTATPPVEERVTLRRSGTTVHALRTGEPGAAVIPAADLDKALQQLKDLSGDK
jgi:hypothetical protein